MSSILFVIAIENIIYTKFTLKTSKSGIFLSHYLL